MMFTVIDADTGERIRPSRFSKLRDAFDCGYFWTAIVPGHEIERDFRVVDEYLNPIPYSRCAR